MAFTIADLFEHTVDVVGDREMLVCGDARFTYSDMDRLANRVGHGLSALGVGAGDHVGIYAQNSGAWVAGMLGTYKVRASPININYRYVADELRYLIGNADVVSLILDAEYVPLALEVIDAAPKLTSLVVIESDAHPVDLDATRDALGDRTLITWSQLVDADDGRGFPERSPDDLYVLYTGGTTGRPKGVMWRQEDVLYALGGAIDAVTGEKVADEYGLAERAAASEGQLTFLLLPPLMHGAGQWGTLTQVYLGNKVVMPTAFDANGAWDLVRDEGVNSLVLTGDAMARPMIEALADREAEDGPMDLSTLISISSTAAIFSATVKDAYLDRFPGLVITDSIGSTETGFNGLTMVAKGQTQISGGGPTVDAGHDVVILDEQLQLIPAGDVTPGVLGRGGNIPLGYYNDPEKTAETFVIAGDGRRYSMPGDFARWTEEGRIVLLGRGSVTINSGGEKIHPEEVEQALKDHPAVYDCLVVGVPDERWGQHVGAVVQFRGEMTAELADLAEHVRGQLARYKAPRSMTVVERIQRAPSGKPDYPWAARLAAENAGA